MKHVIIGTAGHVDHGKTLLVSGRLTWQSQCHCADPLFYISEKYASDTSFTPREKPLTNDSSFNNDTISQ